MATATHKIDIRSDGHIFTLSDVATQAPIYTVIQDWSSIPQLVLSAASDTSGPDQVSSGTATFLQTSGAIEMNVNGRSFHLRRHAGLSQSRAFQSAHNGVLAWEKDGFLSSGLKLVDAQGEVVARFHNKGKLLGSSPQEEWGSFELVAHVSGESLVEVVLSGMAMTLMRGSPNVALLNSPMGMTG